jgi:hypothetical protein
MAYTIELQTITDSRGSLTVIEKVLPFEIKRVYYVYNVPRDASRGGHGHRRSKSALICQKGSCVVKVNSSGEQLFALDRPDLCLVILPLEWHEITDFAEGTLLLVLSSEYYGPTDYNCEKPQ